MIDKFGAGLASGDVCFTRRELLFGQARKSEEIYCSQFRDVSDAGHILMATVD